MKIENSSNNKSTLEADVNKKVEKQPLCGAARRFISSFAKKSWAWIGARMNTHFDRLIALRVYDQRRH